MNKRSLMGIYFRQQAEMAMPDLLIGEEPIEVLRHSYFMDRVADSRSSELSGSGAVAAATDNKSSYLKKRLSSLRPLEQLTDARSKDKPRQSTPAFSDVSVKQCSARREALKKLMMAGCRKCQLAESRTKYVFGSGNADAPIMIIGEAPGREEDEQGLPFVGAAGKLLTAMLAAINIDRTTDVFITNVLKCRPPDNRTPQTTEIITCVPILKRQIEILQPKAILLLGRIAASALLDIHESITKIRQQVFDFNGIPAMVTYHPAALLRNSEYKRPAWEDLQRFRGLLLKTGAYDCLVKK